MDRNELIVTIIVAAFGFLSVMFFLGSPPILEINRDCEPDRFYTQEFTLTETLTIQIEIACENEDADILWYICDCDNETFNTAVDMGNLVDVTYESGLTGGNLITETTTLPANTYIFAFIQTAENIGIQPVTGSLTRQ